MPKPHHATLVILGNPLRPADGRVVRRIARRRRISDLAPQTHLPYYCLLNGEPVLRARWRATKMQRGDIVTFITLPQDGGGGGSDPMRTVLMIAVMIYAPQLGAAMFGAGTVGATIATAGMQMLGGALINAVLPPPKPPAPHQAAALAAPSPTYSVSGQGNMARLGSPIPVLYGRHVLFPDYGARQYAEYLGNEQYLHLLFCLGQGEVQIEQFRFDKTDVSAYGGDVVMEVVPPGGTVTLFPTNVVPSTDVAGQEMPGRKDVTYSQTGTTITITETAHGRTMGSIVKLDFTSGTSVDGEYTIATVATDTWTVTAASATTSGNVSVFSVLGGTGFVCNAAGTLANQICIDVALPQGIGYINGGGGIDTATVRFYSEVQPIDANGDPTGAWQMLPPLNPETQVSFSDSVTQDAAADRYNPTYQTKLTLSHADVQESSIVVKRAGVTISGWTLSVGTGPGGVDEINIPAAHQKNTSLWSTVTWLASYRINSSLFEEVISGATNTPQRRSLIYPVTAGRYRARVVRTDIKNTASTALHTLSWIAMEAYIPGSQNYGNVTMIAMRIRASAMTATAAQKFNVIATRCLPVWAASTGWSAPQPTRSIAWALADAAKATYGGKQTDAQIDLAGLAALDATWETRGDTFDGVFDNAVSLWEAFSAILRAGRSKPIQLGGVVKAIRDEPRQVPAALFTMRNTAHGSFSCDYAFPTAATTDCVEMTYFDEAVWAPRTVMCVLPGGTSDNPAKVQAFGMVSRNQAHREGMFIAACNRYRRALPRFTTEMEGFIPIYGDMIALQCDLTGWGQHAEVIAYDQATGELVLTEEFSWTAGETHYLGVRNRNGSVTAALHVAPGSAANRVLLVDPLPYGCCIDTGGDRERTHVSFGPGDKWRKQVVVTQTTPRGLYSVEIQGVVENPIVHTVETQVSTPPWVGW